MTKIIKLKALLPKTMVLNRPAILLLAGVIVILFLWVFISAFQSPKAAEEKHLVSHVSQGGGADISPMISALPKDYQDVNTIKKYLNPVPPIPPEVTQELNDLRAQTLELQNQLSQIQAHPPAPPTPPVPVIDQATQDAMKSTLLFSGSSSIGEQNKQNKEDSQVSKPLSPYLVQAGSVIPASLLTAINTSLPGDVIAQVTQDIFDTMSGRYLLIPKGSKLLGSYDAKIAYGQQRILISYNRIVRPDGSSIQLNHFNGDDPAGEAGFSANVDNHWGKVLGAATISTLLSFGAGVAADHSGGSSPYYPSAQQNAIIGAAGNVSQVGQSITSKAIDIQPTLTLPAGYNFNVMVNEDLILSPMKE